MFVSLETLEVISLVQLKALFPLVGFPPGVGNEALLEYGFAVLEYDEVPEVSGLDTYKPGQIRIEDGRAIQSWVIVPHVPTEAEITATFEQAIQSTLDAAAQVERYDNINTVISYAEEPAVRKFQEDGKRFRTWRSLVWAYAYEQLALVNSGGRTQPTVAEFLAGLPVLAVSA